MRYRTSVLQPVAIIEPQDAEKFDQSNAKSDAVLKCRHCKRLHVLQGVRSMDDLMTADNVPFSRVGADPVAATG